MKSRNLLSLSAAFAVLALVMIGAQTTPAAPTQPLMTGTYQILSATPASGNLMSVKLQIHLSNLSTGSFSVVGINTSHERAQLVAQPVRLQIASQSSADTTQEFTVLPGQYQRWLHGGPMLLHVSIAGSKIGTGLQVTLVPAGGVK